MLPDQKFAQPRHSEHLIVGIYSFGHAIAVQHKRVARSECHAGSEIACVRYQTYGEPTFSERLGHFTATKEKR